MKQTLVSLFFFLWLEANLTTYASVLIKAELEAYSWINESEKLDLSGLTLCNEKLMTISDKVDNSIYEITWDKTREISADSPFTSQLQLAFTFEVPERKTQYPFFTRLIDSVINGNRLDFEGITCDSQHLFLLSERMNDILSLSHKPPFQTKWLSLNWFEKAHSQGYLNKYNAYTEGVALLEPAKWAVAIERAPRGVIDIQYSSNEKQHTDIKVSTIKSFNLNFRQNSTDIAGLYWEDKHLWTLERNASAVCKRHYPQWDPIFCVSYRHIEDTDRWGYQDSQYGLGEGLAVTQSHIYIVFDNNRNGRKQNPKDTRALLLILKKPSFS